jgi:hypothetical protein
MLRLRRIIFAYMHTAGIAQVILIALLVIHNYLPQTIFGHGTRTNVTAAAKIFYSSIGLLSLVMSAVTGYKWATTSRSRRATRSSA